MKFYIGWDVGAWHCDPKGKKSKDALAILDDRRRLIGLWEGRLSETIVSAQSESNPTQYLIEQIFTLCEVTEEQRFSEGDSFWLSIDTPLGWPKLFRELVVPATSEDEPEEETKTNLTWWKKKINNPFLHRETEVAIGESLSAVQDQIGSQSTKAMFLLAVLSADTDGIGIWKVSNPSLTLIETYPAPCMRSLPFIDRMKSVQSVEGVDPITTDDLLDSVVCAAVAYDMDVARQTINKPTDKCDEDEGWIYVPENSLPKSHGVSYGRLVGSQSPLKALPELLSQIQVGLVLKDAMKASTKKSNHSRLVDEWLEAPKKPNAIFRSTTKDSLRTLFKLLNPNTKVEKYPDESLLKATARRVAGQVYAEEATA